jgi:hypothetical protein
MKIYFAAFAAPIVTIFVLFWMLLGFGIVKPADPDYWLNRAHMSGIATCDLGDLAIIGDSTAVADLLPSRIGPRVRDFGFDGGSPIEAYHASQAMLRCSQRPKAVVVSFGPTTLSANRPLPGQPAAFFWTEAIKFGVLDTSDALAVLHVSRKLNDTLVVGPKSLFEIDYRTKILLCTMKFPPYYWADLKNYALVHITGREAVEAAENRLFFDQTLADDGHHFLGMQADGGTDLDTDANRSGNLISALANYYLRRTIEAYAANGIEVYFVEPPRDVTSAIHYEPSVAANYQGYLANLQRTEPDFHVIDTGFKIWDTTLFGDARHLNLRGASIFSEDVRSGLVSAGLGGSTYTQTELKTKNLVNSIGADAAFWKTPGSIIGPDIRRAVDAPLPARAYPAGSAWLYEAGEARDDPGGIQEFAVQAPAVFLKAQTAYAASVLVKEIDAKTARLQLNWPGGTRASVTWDFRLHRILYAGAANALNSGATLCPGGWVQLFLSASAGEQATVYPGPVVSFSALHEVSAYLYDVTLERGLWPSNYCILAKGESTVEPPP